MVLKEIRLNVFISYYLTSKGGRRLDIYMCLADLKPPWIPLSTRLTVERLKAAGWTEHFETMTRTLQKNGKVKYDPARN